MSEKKVLNIGGVLCVNLDPETQAEITHSAVRELYGLIRHFFGKDKERELVIMLEEAELKEDIITFSFPKEIIIKYKLKKSYTVKLEMGEPTSFYLRELKDCLMLYGNRESCNIILRFLDGPERNNFLTFFESEDFERLSSELKKITVTRWRTSVTVKLFFVSGEKIKLKTSSAEDAIQRITKIL